MLLEENIEEYQNNQRVDKIFIKTKKIYLKKWQIWLHLNLKLRIQKHSYKSEKLSQNTEENFEIHITNDELTFRIYKELSHIEERHPIF